MNILFLNSLGKHKWGGGEKWMVNAGKGLLTKGHRVIVACLPGSLIEQKSKVAGLETWAFGIPVDIAIWKIPVLEKFLKTTGIDAMICCQNRDVRIGARAARRAGIKAIFARQGVQNLSNRKKYIKPFTQYIDGIITNTDSIKHTYESYGWFPGNFIHVIYNGVEFDHATETSDLRKQFQIPENAPIIFSAGRLDRQKGFDLLIEVAAMARQNKQNWHFIVAGEGKQKNSLLTQARELGVAGSFHLAGFTNKVTGMIRESDVFVLPSRYEGMPNALLEAMACGKANIATNVNGAPELVKNGVTGFLVETENPVMIYEKLCEVINDDALRQHMGVMAYRHVKENFTYDKMTNNLEKLLLNQLNKN